MYKYKGKYKKCRECKHVKDIGMILVFVDEQCKNAIKGKNLSTVFKQTCEECQYFVAKKDGE